MQCVQREHSIRPWSHVIQHVTSIFTGNSVRLTRVLVYGSHEAFVLTKHEAEEGGARVEYELNCWYSSKTSLDNRKEKKNDTECVITAV